MATQASTTPITPLLAVAILTSISVAPTGAVLASEVFEGTEFQTIKADKSRSRHSVFSSAGTVAEARWARSPKQAYALGAGGHLVPQHLAPEALGAPATKTDGPEGNDYHFGGMTQRGALTCKPSPATSAEITRLVVEAAQRHEVDVGFAVALVTAESRLDRLRNSPKGARGPMQLKPAAAQQFGVIDMCDPEENIDGGVRYLRELTDEFRNPLLVAAAYSAGEGRVREHGGIPPFQETVEYVADVLNIQMGLEGRDPTAHSVDDPQRSSNASGVITSRQHRKWVGGVMHF